MEQGKSALDYLHEIHQWHDRYFGLSTLLTDATEKEFGGTVTEFHSLSTCLSAAFEELRKIVMTSLVDIGRPANVGADGEEAAGGEVEEPHLSPENLQ